MSRLFERGGSPKGYLFFLYLYFMDALINYLKEVIKLEKTGFRLVFDNTDTKEEIIRLVTIEQLYEKGIDGEGDLIQPEGYSLNTIYGTSQYEGKISKGQRYDHVTLNDSGAFYESFEVIVDNDSFTITANDNKGDKALFDVYGEDVAGLTDDSLDALFLTVRDVAIEILMNLQK